MKTKLLFLVVFSFSCWANNENWIFDSRFAGFDIKQMVINEYPTLRSKAETISHYSGYYNINPFLLAEEILASENKDVIEVSKNLYKSINSNKFNPKKFNFKVASAMQKYGINKELKGDLELDMPALNLPFQYESGWHFNGVHTWTGNDSNSTPMSSIDMTRSWSQVWESFTDSDWVSASHDGVVTKFSSCYLRITHPTGWATDYYHLDNIQFESGDEVLAGQNISNYANTLAQATCQGGTSTGPHLHFSLLKDGVRKELNNIELSKWRIHSGNYSYDSNPTRMWLERTLSRAFAFQNSVTHINGDNEIDYRYSGIYSSRDISGHGVNILITRLASNDSESYRNVVFVTFYTYDDLGNSNFYAGNIDFDNWRTDEIKTVPMIQTSGGNFENLQAIDFETDVVDAGEMKIKFNNCSEVEISFNLIEPSSEQIVNNNLSLTKSIGIPDSVCIQASQIPH